ncbi:protein of unknown function [Methylocella tundrae]|uniref:Methionyl-tRNA synthetase anticodon-binding domain-containing protein n=1 Tax=Methylocella tundrae TaxID=227605 RepID=A0A4U8YYT7_METTU|nr:protein of unknown function [Methylocella tundrae]
MQDYALHLILAEIWRVVADANRYFAAEEPWIKRKTDPARMEAILYVTAEVLRIVAILAQPFMPAAMTKLLDLLAVPGSARGFSDAERALGLAPGRCPRRRPFSRVMWSRRLARQFRERSAPYSLGNARFHLTLFS